MPLIKDLRNATREVPALAAQARESLAQVGAGVNRANATMTLLAIVAFLALGVAVIAITRTEPRHATR